jgi:hypothetical protein
MRLKDGRLADVRIVEASDVRMYVPADWLAEYFIDAAKKANRGSLGLSRAFLGSFSPDLHEIECPGTVHRFSAGETASRYGGFGFAVAQAGKSYGLSHISPATPVKFIGVSARPAEIPLEDLRRSRAAWGEQASAPRGWRRIGRQSFLDDATDAPLERRCVVSEGNPPSEMVAFRRFTATVGLGFAFPAKTVEPDEWRTICNSLEPLFTWLTTAPARRDNNKTFMLGAKP